MTADEKKLHEYLDKHDVDKGNPAMQDIVINSFYNQYDQDNDDEWEEKIEFAMLNFDVFCGYVQKVWVNDSDDEVELTIPFDDDDIPEINAESLTVINLEKEALTSELTKSSSGFN